MSKWQPFRSPSLWQNREVPTSRTTPYYDRIDAKALEEAYCFFIHNSSQLHSQATVVVVRLPRPMEGNGVTPIFRSLQNCQFHHRRLESLEHFNVLYIYIYIILSTTVSHFWTLRMPYFFYKVSLFCIPFHFCKYTLHVCYVFNVNLTDSFDNRRSQFRLI